MQARIFSIRRRSKRERHVLALVRGGLSPDAAAPYITSAVPLLSPEDQLVMDDLRNAARRQRLQIGEADCMFVHRDELTMLLWIAQLQRRVPGALPIQDQKFIHRLSQCSLVLDRIGLRLPLRIASPHQQAFRLRKAAAQPNLLE